MLIPGFFPVLISVFTPKVFVVDFFAVVDIVVVLSSILLLYFGGFLSEFCILENLGERVPLVVTFVTFLRGVREPLCVTLKAFDVVVVVGISFVGDFVFRKNVSFLFSMFSLCPKLPLLPGFFPIFAVVGRPNSLISISFRLNIEDPPPDLSDLLEISFLLNGGDPPPDLSDFSVFEEGKSRFSGGSDSSQKTILPGLPSLLQLWPTFGIQATASAYSAKS